MELLRSDEAWRAVEAVIADGLDSWLSVAQAAKRHGISPRAVRARCAAGALEAKKVNGQWRIQQ
jgi:hypothetical protein